MPTLRWHLLTWEQFLTGLMAYRDEFSGKSREDAAYLRCRKELLGLPIRDRARKARIIVWFCNNWACHLSATDAPRLVAEWIRANAGRLDALSALSILDYELPGTASEVSDLYESLMEAGQAVLTNMSPAAASKILHQLVPSCFVMWDRNILPFADDYRDFTTEMHDVGSRLVNESPFTRETVEPRLQTELGYAVTKTFAKYLDEYNWYVMVGGPGRG